MPVFTMPSLGADMEAGTLVEWMVKPGDAVKRGDVVAVVETQKGAIEIECFEEGTVASLDAALGQELPVGAPLATIRAPGEAAAPAASEPAPPKPAPPKPAPPKPAPAETAAPKPAAPKPAPHEPAPGPTEARPEPKAETAAEAPHEPPPQAVPPGAPAPAALGEAPPASPAARALAAERGLDLARLAGSGPGGAVLLADVEAAAAFPPQAAPAGPAARPSAKPAAKPGLDMAAMRAAIAAAMARAKREIPHYYLSQTIDLEPATDWLAKTNAKREPDARLLLGALLVKAAALAAAKVPEMNGHYGPEGFRPAPVVHAGVAVALRGGGLIAPALKDAARLGLDDTMTGMKDLVARARTGRLRSSEMTDGTITISAMGESGAEAMAAVIFPPQVAILGIGAPVIRPWVVGKRIVARSTLTITLSADHRVSDGRRGAKFLAEIDKALQTPEAL